MTWGSKTGVDFGIGIWETLEPRQFQFHFALLSELKSRICDCGRHGGSVIDFLLVLFILIWPCLPIKKLRSFVPKTFSDSSVETSVVRFCWACFLNPSYVLKLDPKDLVWFVFVGPADLRDGTSAPLWKKHEMKTEKTHINIATEKYEGNGEKRDVKNQIKYAQ